MAIAGGHHPRSSGVPGAAFERLVPYGQAPGGEGVLDFA